jgi:hypothetical protein
MSITVLLILHYLIQEILVEGVLDVHARGVDDNNNPYRNMVMDMMRIKVMTINVQS